MRQKPDDKLTSEGRKLAKHVAQASLIHKNITKVVSSTLARAIYTANAMGYEVDDTIKNLGYLPAKVLAAIDWPCTINDAAYCIENHNSCLTFAQLQANIWQQMIEQTPIQQTTLIITHGAFIELGINAFVKANSIHYQSVAAIKEDFFDKTIGYCEGIEIQLDNGVYTIKPLRVVADRYLVDS
jgi:hypothetical protein